MLNNRNIVLVGYRCSGKTSVGKHLAQEMERKFVDTDAWIEEEARCSIEALICRHGWRSFRSIEKELIQELSRGTELVLATGGGVVTDEENVRILKRTGHIIWLTATAEVLKQRMLKDRREGKFRPSLTGSDPLEEITSVLSARIPYYEQASDLVVDTTFLDPSQAASLILKNVREGCRDGKL